MDRDELDEKIRILREEIKTGRLKIPDGLEVIASLKRVRTAPDGKVDPNSVDGLVRSLANVATYNRFRNETKKVPLRESQARYFEILEKFFGEPFTEMKKHGVTPQQIAEHLASLPRMVKAFASDVQEFEAGINEFWEYYGPVVETHLQELSGLKSIFGGDIFPSYLENIATSVGLYVDTVILPDPLLRTLQFASHMKPERTLQFVAKHALNALQYRDLALADVDPPIVVISPDPSYSTDPYRSILQVAGEADLVQHSERLFGRSFTDLAQLDAYLGKFSTPKELVASIVEPRRLLFDTEWSGPLDQQIQKYYHELLDNLGPQMAKAPASQVVRTALLGRMMQANDLMFKASRLQGHPLVDAPTSWQYLLWKYEYDGERDRNPEENIRDVLITKAISVEGSERLGLLYGLPPEVLIELRRSGALSGLREIIRKGIDDVDSASASSFADVGEAVVTNLSDAFAQHRKELEQISAEQKKFFGFDVSRWFAFGGISIGAAALGSPALAVLAASLGMVGAPPVDELWKRWKDFQSRKIGLKRSPTGVLFRHLKRQ